MTPAGTARAENPFFVPSSEAQKISWSRARGKLPRSAAERIQLENFTLFFILSSPTYDDEPILHLFFIVENEE